MPYWCINVVTLKHKDKQHLELIANAYNDGKLLSQLLKDSTEEDPKIKSSWRFDNWGTSKEIQRPHEDDVEPLLEKEGDEWFLDLNFETAWTPPLKLYSLLNLEGYKVQAYFWESVKGYCGRFLNNNEAFYPIEVLNSQWTSANLPTDIDFALGITERLEEWEEYEFELEQQDKETSVLFQESSK
jgi:hypothetical protein